MSTDVPAGFVPFPPHGSLLGLVGPLYEREGADPPVLGLRIDPDRHLNGAGTAHGGLLATVVDTALGLAIRTAGDEVEGAVTVSLTTDYLGPVEAGAWVEARTEVERLGGRLAFADCSLVADGREAVRARAVFSVLT